MASPLVGEVLFGYVTPLKEEMKCSDFMMYRAFYCGICKCTGKMFGQLPRFTTNYDITFLSVLLHDFLSQEVIFETKGCVGNPFKKKVTVCSNTLLDKIIEANIILSYYKLKDAVVDKEGLKKRIAKKFFEKPYKKAKLSSPEVDIIVENQYAELFRLERENFVGIDRVADCFARLLEQVAKVLLGDKANDKILKLCYNVGKFVYLTDALDDVDEDFRKKRYNPFLASYPGYENRQQYFNKYDEEFKFILAITINRAIECFNEIQFNQSRDLICNIIHKGLRGKADELFKSTKKLPKPKL